jgi:hypothetical protein
LFRDRDRSGDDHDDHDDGKEVASPFGLHRVRVLPGVGTEVPLPSA